MEVHLSADIFLEGCRGSAPAINLSIKGRDNEEAAGNPVDIWPEHLWLVGPGKGPTHIARSVPAGTAVFYLGVVMFCPCLFFPSDNFETCLALPTR